MKLHLSQEARDAALQQSIKLLREVLDSLDKTAAPSDIGAHVDRALCRLLELTQGKF
jgi:hypothetical protein